MNIAQNMTIARFSRQTINKQRRLNLVDLVKSTDESELSECVETSSLLSLVSFSKRKSDMMRSPTNLTMSISYCAHTVLL